MATFGSQSTKKEGDNCNKKLDLLISLDLTNLVLFGKRYNKWT